MNRFIRSFRPALLVVAAIVFQTLPADAKWPYTANLGPLSAALDGPGLPAPEAVAFDAAGNSYFAGPFTGTITIGGMDYVSAGFDDIVVVKLDSDGNLLWTRTAGGTLSDYVNALAVDSAGNVYLAGSFCRPSSPLVQTCSATFGEVGTVMVPGGASNSYVARLSSAGAWEWVREVIGDTALPFGSRLTSIAVDGNDVFVGGWFQGTLTSPSGGGMQEMSRAPGTTDALFAKVSTAGSWAASQTWPASGTGSYFTKSIVKQGNELVAVVQPMPESLNPETASVNDGPVYALPNGGSCTVTGLVGQGGARVSCTGVNLDPLASIYYGIKNDTNTNLMSMTGAAPVGGSIFRYSGATGTTLSYTSSTSVAQVTAGPAADVPPAAAPPRAVSSVLTISPVSGVLSLVNSGSVASNGNGDTSRLYQVGSSSFAVDVKITVNAGNLSGNPDQVFTTSLTPAASGGDSVSSVDLGFYYLANSALVTLAASDLAVLTPDGVDLGFAADVVAGDGTNGLATAGFVPTGNSVTFGGKTVNGPGLAVVHFGLANPAGPLTGQWVSKAEGSAFSGSLSFGPGDNLYVSAVYKGLLFFEPNTILDLEPLTSDSGDDALVAAIDTGSGNWSWATRLGGTGSDTANDIAVDSANPNQEVIVVGNYVAPTAFGEFDFDRCENTCPVQDGLEVRLESCNPVNAEDLCLISPCNLPLLCLGGEAPPANTAFAMKLTDEGDQGGWLLPVERWIVGEEVPRPAGLPAIAPSVEISGLSSSEAGAFFFWAPHEGKFYAVAPTELPAKVRWQKDVNPAQGTEAVDGVVRYPNSPQVHIGSAPVDVELPGDRCPAESDRPFALCERDQDCGSGHDCAPLTGDALWTFAGILYRSSDSDAQVDAATKVFTATAGWSTLLFSNGPTPNPDNSDVAIVVVRTFDPLMAISGQPESCIIGSALDNPDHMDPNGKNGWVVFDKAHFDGEGVDAAYTRDPSRKGPILPVNRDREEEPKDEMLVAWYEQDERGIAWPKRPILYDCQWPTDADTIIIASGLGSDGRCADVRGTCQLDADCSAGTCLAQPSLNVQDFPDAHLYSQSDPELPGFNPNEEHAILLPSNAGTGANAVFALRTDLNESEQHSDPFVLLKYRDPATQEWRMRVYGVSVVDETYTDTYDSTAGMHIAPPYPLTLLEPCAESCAPTLSDCGSPAPECLQSECVGGSLAGEVCTAAADCLPPCLQGGGIDSLCGGVKNRALFKDHLAIGADGTWRGWWAQAAGTLKARYHYPIQAGFFADLDLDGTPDPNLSVGTCEPFLVSGSTHRDVTYHADWPEDPPVLLVGETLLEPKGDRGLPAISSQAAAQVLFETSSASAEPSNEQGTLVRLMDPLSPRAVPLADGLPVDVLSVRVGPNSKIVGGQSGSVKLSPGVSARVGYNSTTKTLSIAGIFDESSLGEPSLMLNVMTALERDELKALSTEMAWKDAIDALFALSRNPNAVDQDNDGSPDEALHVGLQMQGTTVVPEKIFDDKALTAGLASSTGFVTVAFNNDPNLAPLPISLEVIRVDCAPGGQPSPYQGQVHLVPATNIFDEQITLRHSGDFAGDPTSKNFEWFFALKEKDCQSTPVPLYPATVSAPWIPLDSGMGVNTVTLGGPGITSLADTCVIARYTGYSQCMNQTVPSQWAGAPLGPTQFADPKSQLVPGWLNRVTDGLNPFDQRTTDWRNSRVNTFANILTTAGERFEGPIAFNPDADALNDVGLIEIYETVLDRGRDLSIDADMPVNVGAVNSKLLDVAARISDLYMLLGNEAFGDALDPTIAFNAPTPITLSDEFKAAAPSIFAFQDQLDSLLAEELALLRGRDDTAGAGPVYNRLVWNFTGRDGQLAYQQNYNITNQTGEADIDELDAAVFFPQGHGDAWGHYLTAIKAYYHLLRHPSFEWLPRSDSVLVAGSEVLVDFTDERRFARAASSRARSGAQIVDLTYRQQWVDDPSGQWQGYKDTNTDRAFGVSEWAQRAGQGAYFDWVVANSILPPQSDAPPGIEKIDRTTVPELNDIASQSADIQSQLDLVDNGMNPLGLAKNVVPFDIDPLFLDLGSAVQGKTHFEQIADRATEALGNAMRVFEHANGLTQLLRRNQDNAVDFGANLAGAERGYNNRLIEIFGTPYPEDIGPAGTYGTGYGGPDIWNWDIADPSEITGLIPSAGADVSAYSLDVPVPQWGPCTDTEGTCEFDPSAKLKYNSDGTILTTMSAIPMRVSNRGLGRVKDPRWSTRESPGELQLARSDLLQQRAALEKAVQAYSKLIADIECDFSTIVAQNRLAAERMRIRVRGAATQGTFNGLIRAAKGTEIVLNGIVRSTTKAADLGADAFPGVVGLANDVFSGARAALKSVAVVVNSSLQVGADAAKIAQLAFDQAADIAATVDAIEIQGLEDDFAAFNLLGTLGEKVRREPLLRIDAFTAAERVRQSVAKLSKTLSRGIRLLDEHQAVRKFNAGKVAARRFNDLAFRVFRNDALQKYRAQLDLASQFVYLAAAAYDYDTNLQGDADQAGRRFLTDIVRQRSLGQFVDGQPIAGSAGLGDVMAQMTANFGVLKGSLGFNNPQTETNRFSLRSELFRILGKSDAKWRSTLAKHRVDNLWEIDEFRRLARPPRAEADGPLPGIVIPIPTNVTFGLNFFGWPLAGGDSAYDSTNFATKVRTVGVWLGNYNAQGLSNTPRVYLIPTGADVLRSPTSGNFRTREWTVVDQRIPVPFPIGNNELNDQLWSPRRDSLSDPIGGIRRFSSFQAFHDSGSFNEDQVTTESRAIGRSVWNTRWMLIIPGGTLLADSDEGLDTLIYGQPTGGEGGVLDPEGVVRDGAGISDILLFFQTYALSGN